MSETYTPPEGRHKTIQEIIGLLQQTEAMDLEEGKSQRGHFVDYDDTSINRSLEFKDGANISEAVADVYFALSSLYRDIGYISVTEWLSGESPEVLIKKVKEVPTENIPLLLEKVSAVKNKIQGFANMHNTDEDELLLRAMNNSVAAISGHLQLEERKRKK